MSVCNLWSHRFRKGLYVFVGVFIVWIMWLHLFVNVKWLTYPWPLKAVAFIYAACHYGFSSFQPPDKANSWNTRRWELNFLQSGNKYFRLHSFVSLLGTHKLEFCQKLFFDCCISFNLLLLLNYSELTINFPWRLKILRPWNLFFTFECM